VIIERCLKGEEATILAFTDGKTFKVMPPLQDHKPLYDNDQGPNTGGMGSLAPTPLITKEVFKEIEERIIKPTMQGLNKEGLGGAGILYFGLMITPEGSYVLEYNVRFGDPEAQGVLPLLKSDLYPILSACVEGKLDEVKIQWKEEAAVCVIISTKGYPLNYGYERELIEGIEEAEKMKDIIIYHAGTKLMDGKFITHGGRILGVTGVGENIKQAKERAYKAVGKIHFKEMHYRRDIGDKAIKCNSTQT
jgi:phosphoribosylamine--glycine ligase